MDETVKDSILELENLYPEGRYIAVNGEKVEVKPFKFKQLLKALKYLSEMTGDIVKFGDLPPEMMFLNLFANYPDQVIGLLKLATGKDDDFFDTLDSDAGLELIALAYKVNEDFFIQKVGPKLSAVLGHSILQSGQKIKSEENLATEIVQ